MVCPACGENVTENAGFCPNCGTRLSQAQSQQSAPGNGVDPVDIAAASKRAYISKAAPSHIKQKAKLGWITSLVCLTLLLISYFVVMNTSIENVPIVSKVLSLTDGTDGFDESKDGLVDMVEDLEDRFEAEEDELEDMFSKKEIRKLKQFIKTAKKCAKTISIRNVKKLMSNFEDLLESSMADHMDLDGDTLDGLQETNNILNGIRTFLLIGALVCAFFVVCGGLFRKTALICIGMALSVIYCLLFCGVLLMLLNLAAHTVLIFFTLAVNKAYKARLISATNA